MTYQCRPTTTPELTHWSERLSVLHACDDSLRWAAKKKSPIAAWRTCERGDWLLWIAARLGVDRQLIVTATCKCARLALPYVPEGEDRPLKAIEAAERWVDGLVTIDEVRQAASAACSAAYAAAYAAARAAYSADRAADARAAAVAAADVASGVARAAADAADAYAPEDAYASGDAYNAVLSQCADIVRSVISEDVMLEAWSNEEEVK